MIASSTAVTINQRQKHIALAIDLLLGIGMPMLVMALHYIVQPHRVDIIEGYGCQPVTWPGIPALFAVTWWSPLLTIIAAGYGGKWQSSISQCPGQADINSLRSRRFAIFSLPTFAIPCSSEIFQRWFGQPPLSTADGPRERRYHPWLACNIIHFNCKHSTKAIVSFVGLGSSWLVSYRTVPCIYRPSRCSKNNSYCLAKMASAPLIYHILPVLRSVNRCDGGICQMVPSNSG